MIAHEKRGKWPLERRRDRDQRLLERNAAGDLLQDLGLVRGELGGAALVGDVVTDRLVLDDLAGGRSANARSVHWYQRREPSSETSRSTWVRTESPLGERLEPFEHARALRRRPQVDELHPRQVVAVAAEELGERAVGERQRRVGTVPAHELGLVVDDGAVARLALAQARLRSRAAPPRPACAR